MSRSIPEKRAFRKPYFSCPPLKQSGKLLKNFTVPKNSPVSDQAFTAFSQLFDIFKLYKKITDYCLSVRASKNSQKTDSNESL